MAIFSEDVLPHDIPTLFQVAVAQETCQREIESLHVLYQKSQEIADYQQATLKQPGEVIELLFKEIKQLQAEQ